MGPSLERMAVAQTDTIPARRRSVPVVLPNRNDPRLHTAAVIITIHTIGITALGFEVSVPQILSAILAAGLIDVAVEFGRTRRIVWPASGMLTGSGVALILRYVPTSSGEYWSWEGWWWFAAVAGGSLLTKHLIRTRSGHVFNPSNLGLVVAFLLVDSGVLEPLDFWWSAFDAWMALAYGVIVAGGILITRRLGLVEMAAAFWVFFVGGIGLLAASGHCMIATWSTTPVCGSRFWTTLIASPEVLIFLFFMITDPKTVPRRASARVAFAAGLAVTTVVMIAPHGTEYGAKVGLLASLVLWSGLRYVVDRLIPDATTPRRSGIHQLAHGLLTAPRSSAVFARGVALGTLLVVIGAGIVWAGGPAREAATVVDTDTLVPDVDVPPLPDLTVRGPLEGVDLGDTEVDSLPTALAENLALEAMAIRDADTELLALADGGRRLIEMQGRIDDGITEGRRPADTYHFDTLELHVAGEAEGQATAALALDGSGTVETSLYDANGEELSRSSRAFEATFVLRRLTTDRWHLVDVRDG